MLRGTLKHGLAITLAQWGLRWNSRKQGIKNWGCSLGFGFSQAAASRQIPGFSTCTTLQGLKPKTFMASFGPAKAVP